MTNRRLAFIFKDQNPLTMAAGDTVQHACRKMCERRIGAVLVIDGKIVGIVSRGDFKGLELDRLEDETHLWERIG